MMWKRATKAGGFLGLLAGTASSIGMWLWVKHDPSNIRFMIFQPHASPETIIKVQAMAENMYRGAWSWCICVLVTVVVSLMTKPKTDAELTGLVYGATVIPSDGSTSFFQKPIFWASLVAIALVVVNIIFW